MKNTAYSKLLSVVAVAMAMSAGAKADLTFEFNTPFSALGTQPAGTVPWLTAVIADDPDPGYPKSVLMTLTANLQGSGEKIKNVWFNLDPAISLNLISGAVVSTSGLSTPSVDVPAQPLTADGGGIYDISLGFSEGGPATSIFGGTDSLVVRWTRSDVALTPSDFDFVADTSGSWGPYKAAAHVLGIEGQSQASIFIAPTPVPEASTVIGMAMLGLPIGFGVFRQLRRSR